MTANVITYRDRSAAREVAKALGFSREQEDRLAKQLGHFRYDLERGDPKLLERELAAAGFDPEEPRNRLFARLLAEDPEPAAPPRAALGRHGDRRRPARRGRAARAGGDAGAHHRAVGQGRLRRPRDHQGRPPRARDAQRARGGDPDHPRPRAGERRPRPPAGRRPEGLRHAARRRHGRRLPGREPRPDGLAAEERARPASTISSSRSPSSGRGRSPAAWCIRSSSAGGGASR